jgi:phage FluMu protein Com
MTIPLDGNAIGGSLLEFFGTEMTAVRGTCTHCGGVSVIAELAVYLQAPGAVVRCPTCESVVMVLVTVHEHIRVDASQFRLADPHA